MRIKTALLIALAFLASAVPAQADLNEIEIGGSIEIYGAWYTDFFARGAGHTPWPGFVLPGRSIGAAGLLSPVDADGDGHSLTFIEQRTRLNVKASFTDNVSAFVELDSQDIWGQDFRSNYITGFDGPAVSTDDVEIYQSYIEAANISGRPLRLRVGRQELTFGDEWLVGPNLDADPFTSHSFDALRITYDEGPFVLDAFAAQVAETFASEEDGDAWFYGLYGRYTGWENTELDAYYYFLRDGRAINDTNFIAPVEALENGLGIDDYDPTVLHTAGMRVSHIRGPWDFYAEGAYQWGEANHLGALYRPFSLYGDDGANYDTWAGVIEVGYTFEKARNLRLSLHAVYYGSDDNRDLSFADWINPFDQPEASVAFNRLFSGQRHEPFLDSGSLSNIWIISASAQLPVTDKLSLSTDVQYLQAINPFNPPAHIHLGCYRLPIAPALSFWTDSGEDDMGVEWSLSMDYAYSPDLLFQAGWTHYFVGEALEDGVFIENNGTVMLGGSGNADADMLWFQTTVSF